ncbi:VTT domain-containing protein [Polaromonas jejuensis]|uniref:VTT domain-containing protein n=1 Tax=Polaromonas jejuensis TaxID=457502 RepID=A0ABW0Q6T8_9BURK|nr:VTT domain-containing protein [Polaromonas jejuensis]
MDITPITEAIQRDALWVVFVNVLLQQLGLPIPAVPTLLVAGSLAASSGRAGQMLAAAVLASVLADWIWYLAGRAFGYRVLSALCRLSINPGSCVSETEGRFIQWGAWSLVVAKFVPGFSIVAPPIAGSLRMPLPSFVAAAGLGAALWAGAAIFAGWWLRAELQTALEIMNRHGGTAVVAVAMALGVWLVWKLWQKYRFEQLAAIPHITPVELAEALKSKKPPLLLDFRGDAMIAQEGPIARATPARLDDLPQAVGPWPKDHRIVTLCACPQDATAVRAARVLMKLGYTSVRPLKGGYDAWMKQLGEPGHGSR